MDKFSLAGKRALVTGAGRGLGRATAEGLAAAGAKVALVSRTSAEIEEVAAAIGANAVACPGDISATAAIPGMLDEIEKKLGGAIDVVLHAAGVQHRQPAQDFDPAEWDRVINVNLTAPFLLSQQIGKRQIQRGMEGSHIFIGSLSSHISLPDVVAYTASKSGIYGLIRNLSTEWSRYGIRVNGIGPGYFRTKLTEAVFADPERQQQLMDRIPMQRFGDPEDLAGAAVFLASPAAGYVTGQLLMVDGGWIAS
ncbi:SDR family oxidoreductase [Arthrobacter sp. W4I7]|uniref:SDR family oxidoreductase n=1 Tax=Arthrobacter sp. W4I7 TaxID=3042296 RepID=UPI0027D8330D|nr:SDR family oxidoreductase [Arthrobacter sp. W4I7]